LDVLHGDEALLAVPDLVDPRHARVARRQLDLERRSGAFGLPDLLAVVRDLERHAGARLGIARLVHLGHPAAREVPLELVASDARATHDHRRLPRVAARAGPSPLDRPDASNRLASSSAGVGANPRTPSAPLPAITLPSIRGAAGAVTSIPATGGSITALRGSAAIKVTPCSRRNCSR